MLPTVATWAETTFNYAYDGQTLTYRVTNESKKICEVQENPNISGSLTIPSEANGYSVRSIVNNAFSNCSDLTSVTISDYVNSIGDGAFESCSGLTSVIIPNSVISIDSNAFSNCSGLRSITIGNSVAAIGESAFEGCSGLTSVIIPNSVTSIGDYAFSRCTGLTSVTINSDIPDIETIKNYSGQTSVSIPNSVIGRCAFENCSSLESVYYGANNPISATKDVFSDYSKPTLYVKGSAMNKIKATIPWSLFEKIKKYDF